MKKLVTIILFCTVFGVVHLQLSELQIRLKKVIHVQVDHFEGYESIVESEWFSLPFSGFQDFFIASTSTNLKSELDYISQFNLPALEEFNELVKQRFSFENKDSASKSDWVKNDNVEKWISKR